MATECVTTRSGFKVWRFGNRLTLAPTKTKARRNFREEFGCVVKSGEVLPFRGPFHLYDQNSEESWEATESEFVRTVQTFGADIVCEG